MGNVTIYITTFLSKHTGILYTGHLIVTKGCRLLRVSPDPARLSHYYYYLSNLSIDWVAPKGIACSRVLPKTHTDIHITNTTKKKNKITKQKTNYRQITTKKTKTKLQNKSKS